MDADTLDSCKENIQPLRHGRKAQQLGIALQAQNDTNLQSALLREREEFEYLIQTYDGPDPLQPRYDFVNWIEQSYPTHGRESNLVPLLEETITLFKDDDRYRQDPRFVALIIKFVETQVNPLELYQFIYNQGIGTMCSALYKAWAEDLDLAGDLKRADQVFQLGISNRAEPRDLLIQEHSQFQLSVGRRMLSGLSLDDPPPDPDGPAPRQVLGKIKKKNVGSVRPTLGKAGIMPLCLSNRNPPKANAPIVVYDENSSDNLPMGSRAAKTEHIPKSDWSKKENTLKPGTWNKAYKTATSAAHLLPITPKTPTFTVHEDAEDQSVPSTPRPSSIVTNALKTRKADTFHCPLAIFEPPDPSVKAMYPKHKVYSGGREFQLEEIMAFRYLKDLKDREAKLSSSPEPTFTLDDEKDFHTNPADCSDILETPGVSTAGPVLATPFSLGPGSHFKTPLARETKRSEFRNINKSLKFTPAPESLSELSEGKLSVYQDETVDQKSDTRSVNKSLNFASAPEASGSCGVEREVSKDKPVFPIMGCAGRNSTLSLKPSCPPVPELVEPSPVSTRTQSQDSAFNIFCDEDKEDISVIKVSDQGNPKVSASVVKSILKKPAKPEQKAPGRFEIYFDE